MNAEENLRKTNEQVKREDYSPSSGLDPDKRNVNSDYEIEELSEENISEYGDLFFNGSGTYSTNLIKDEVINFDSEYSQSFEKLLEPTAEKAEPNQSQDCSDLITTRDDSRHSIFNRNCSSEHDIRFLKLEARPKTESDERVTPPINSKALYRPYPESPENSEFNIKDRRYKILWEIENKQKQIRKLVNFGPKDYYRSEPKYFPNISPRHYYTSDQYSDRRRSEIEWQKKRVRFSVSRMEGDQNFRATLSIKNEADGQTVFYKVDKNRFKKEKTIKLMVETMYRVDISFKPTQTLARALVRGHEVKTIERVHDSTASAYSLHLPTRSFQASPKGHRDEITFLIQFANGLVLQTNLQVKFYKAGDTQHCEWGSTFHCVEYDCEPYPEGGVISVLKETFR